MDNRSLANLNTLHPRLKQIAIDAWTQAQAEMPLNTLIIVVQGGRTFEESNALYAQGRTEPGEIVTNAPAGESFHNYFLAFDFAMITNGKDDYVVGPNWMKVVKILKSHGFEWGGDWTSIKDYPHFEMRFGHTWQQLLAKYKAKDFIPGTEYVNI